jgi:hypothetical protein
LCLEAKANDLEILFLGGGGRGGDLHSVRKDNVYVHSTIGLNKCAFKERSKSFLGLFS